MGEGLLVEEREEVYGLTDLGDILGLCMLLVAIVREYKRKERSDTVDGLR
jgi:hypothetical protein